MAHQSIPGAGSGLQFVNHRHHHHYHHPFGDTTYTKVFVGGLAWETQSETLRRHFEQFGEILEAVVINDKHTGRSKGYGFVTFRDPESAKKACVDPNPVIDGRRANCNLASLGRPQPYTPYGHPRSAMQYYGIPQIPRSAYVGSPIFHRPVSFNYQAGTGYPAYGYTGYGSEYFYPQGIYNPYMGQNYLQMYGVPGTVNTNILPYGQMVHPSQGYQTIQANLMPGHVPLYGGPRVNGVTTETVVTTQPPYQTGITAPAPAPGQARIIFPAHPPQIIQSNGSDPMAG
ncbi:uncharacterized protein LOC127800724 [Diospyros lotus]|uniref:uncharacterized protein LOC127800724 n=1 Tax=Diospyros lotus TaxID=55363 RepID=UPI0022577086|nr:uncharacterized protein LOC127800724 [Diospyros lotus]XP_052191462.1 uncharacterized protein LOC127800724 [Diospyros lotus]